MGNSKVNNGKRYTMKQKIEALKVLESNDYKWKLTGESSRVEHHNPNYNEQSVFQK